MPFQQWQIVLTLCRSGTHYLVAKLEKAKKMKKQSYWWLAAELDTNGQSIGSQSRRCSAIRWRTNIKSFGPKFVGICQWPWAGPLPGLVILPLKISGYIISWGPKLSGFWRWLVAITKFVSTPLTSVENLNTIGLSPYFPQSVAGMNLFKARSAKLGRLAAQVSSKTCCIPSFPRSWISYYILPVATRSFFSDLPIFHLREICILSYLRWKHPSMCRERWRRMS